MSDHPTVSLAYLVFVKKYYHLHEEYIYKYYYLLTAYKLEGKDAKRNKIERLYLRKNEGLL